MTAFQYELQALLTKYNATIDWGCSPCSDTHGIYDECMEVTDDKGNSLLRIDGGSISAYDIKLACSED